MSEQPIWPGMKALSLTQPWATLIALKHKRIETRSWRTSYTGSIAIHAAKSWPAGIRKGESFTIGDFEVERDEAGLLLRGESLAWPYRLPMGGFVATATLCGCVPVGSIEIAGRFQVAPTEEEYGDYSPGRYGWLLNDIVPIKHAIPAKGALGLWEVA